MKISWNFVYLLFCQLIFSYLFIFIIYLFTISAICLHLSAVCLQLKLFVYICQLFVYFLLADFQLFIYNLNFHAKI